MNSAQIIHLLLQVQHLIAGHHFHPWVWIGCTSRPGSPAEVMPHLARGGCTVIRVAPHSIRVTW